mgnify:CR=1 FL=1
MKLKILTGGLGAAAAVALFTGSAFACPSTPGEVTVIPDFGCELITAGANSMGQLGDGTVSVDRTNPVRFKMPVGESPKVVEIIGASTGTSASGAYGVLVVTGSGKVYGAGVNNHGQLGNGIVSASPTPYVATPSQFILPAGQVAVSVTSGYYDAYVLTAQGKVYGAGANQYGQLGAGAALLGPDQATAVEFNLQGEHAARVIVQTDWAGVITTEGSLFMAGKNTDGQLGNGTQLNQATPARFQVPAGETVVDAIAGRDVTVVLTASGKIYSAGANTYGELGIGSTGVTTIPVQFPMPAGVRATSMKYHLNSLFVLGDNGRLYGSGRNDKGQLGNGTGIATSTPAEYALPAGVQIKSFVVQNTATPSEDLRTFVITTTGALYGSGNNGLGELGIGNSMDQLTPVRVPVPGNEPVAAVYPGNELVQLLTTSGKVFGSGNNPWGQLGNGSTGTTNTLVEFILPPGSRGVHVAVSLGYSYVQLEDGTTYGSGWNANGNLGDGTTTHRQTPVKVNVPSNRRIRRVQAINSKHAFVYALACSASGTLTVTKNSVGDAARPGTWSFTLATTTPFCNYPPTTHTIPGTDGSTTFTDLPVFADDGSASPPVCDYILQEATVAGWSPEIPDGPFRIAECADTPVKVTNRSAVSTTTTTMVPTLPSRTPTTTPTPTLPATGAPADTAGAVTFGGLLIGLGLLTALIARRRLTA